MMDPHFQLAIWSTLVCQEALQHMDSQIGGWEFLSIEHLEYRSHHVRRNA